MKRFNLYVFALTAALFMSVPVFAQDAQNDEGSNIEEVRTRSEQAFNELDAQFIDDLGDSTAVYDLTTAPEPVDTVKEEESAPVEFNFSTETDTTYSYSTSPDFTTITTAPIDYGHNQKIGDETDRAYIIFSRIYRRPTYAISNPANIGVKSQTLFALSLPGLPFPNIGLSLQNNSFNLSTLNTYFNDGRLLTPEELSNFVNLFYDDGLTLNGNLSLPTLLGFRFPVGYGSMFINTGLKVETDGTLPGEVLAIPFKGIHFDEPVYTENLKMVVGTYLKTNMGYGTDIRLAGIGDLRVGAGVNLYTGSFATIDTKHLQILSTPDSVTVSGSAYASYLDVENPNFDPASVASVQPGYDIGVGLHLRLGELLPWSELRYNDLDIQVGVQDIGATLSSGEMVKKHYSMAGSVADLQVLQTSDNLDSLLNMQEIVLDSGFVDKYNISTKMNLTATYQPLSFLLLEAGMTTFLTNGLGYDDAPHWKLNAWLFPAKWFNVTVGVQQGYARQMTYNSGFALIGKHYEFGLDTYLIGGMGDQVSGLGVRITNNLYF